MIRAFRVVGRAVVAVVGPLTRPLYRRRAGPVRYACPHDDRLCDRYGCPADPTWAGDRRAAEPATPPSTPSTPSGATRRAELELELTLAPLEVRVELHRWRAARYRLELEADRRRLLDDARRAWGGPYLERGRGRRRSW